VCARALASALYVMFACMQVGTDPVYHYSAGIYGALKLIQSGIAFATSSPNRTTGAYISLSCSGSNVDYSFLNPFGGNWTGSGTDCAAAVSIREFQRPSGHGHVVWHVV
jgi:hypothetical protein